MYPLSRIQKLLKSIIKKIAIVATFSGITLSSYAYQDIDKAVAVVEKDVILQSELDQRIAMLRNSQPEIKMSEANKRRVLDQLILENLQLQIGKRVNAKISEAELNQAVQNLKGQIEDNGINFETYLANQNMSYEKLKNSMEKELIIRKIQEGNIFSRIRITEREIDDFLESSAGQDWQKARFRLSHILLPVKNNNETQAIQLAQNILKEAQKSPNGFQQFAVRFSAGPNASKGGDLGWRTKEELPALFFEQVESLKVGETTQAFKSNAGIHLLKVIKRSGAEPYMVNRYKVRHILISPTELFTDAEAKSKIDSIYQEIKNGVDFAELAKKHTEDTSSKAEGGDVGWSTPGKFVPEFEREMVQTPVGEVSKPFRSQFGWHILKVDDSRTDDMYETVKRNQVVGILRQRRFNDELELWLREIREDAYVELLI